MQGSHGKSLRTNKKRQLSGYTIAFLYVSNKQLENNNGKQSYSPRAVKSNLFLTLKE